MRHWQTLAALMAVALLTIGPAAIAQDGDTATVILHPRVCDTVPADGDWYGACHDERFFGGEIPLQRADGGDPIRGTSDGQGSVVFSVEPGDYNLLTAPGDFLEGGALYCAETATPGVEIPAFPLSLEAGDSVTCDYYIVPSCAAADPNICGGDATATQPAPEVADDDAEPSDAATDPAPPTDVADAERLTTVYAGTCDDLGEAVVDVSVIEAPGGDPAGSTEAIPAATAFFVVDEGLDDLLAEDHVVVVLAPADDANAVTACGPIGGVAAADGSLTIGLRGEPRFGEAGIAYLAPDADGTAVTVFLAAGLGEDEGTPAAN